MGDDFIMLEKAAERSGLHPNSIRRLLRRGATVDGRVRRIVSVRSLKQYADLVAGFLLELSGPKLFLKKRGDGEVAKN